MNYRSTELSYPYNSQDTIYKSSAADYLPTSLVKLLQTIYFNYKFLF